MLSNTFLIGDVFGSTLYTLLLSLSFKGGVIFSSFVPDLFNRGVIFSSFGVLEENVNLRLDRGALALEWCNVAYQEHAMK